MPELKHTSFQKLAFWARRALIKSVLRALSLAVFCSLAANAAETGQPVPEWQLEHWMNATPLKLSDRRGKVVLIRWWTAPGCQYCASTAPALNEFYRDYAKRGLEVIGAYHHKSQAPLDPKQVERAAKKFGFKFPVAIDPDWRTLNAWYLNDHTTGFTSLSFLVDRRGLLRYVHPGGEYVKGRRDYREIKGKIERLLAEP